MYYLIETNVICILSIFYTVVSCIARMNFTSYNTVSFVFTYFRETQMSLTLTVFHLIIFTAVLT